VVAFALCSALIAIAGLLLRASTQPSPPASDTEASNRLGPIQIEGKAFLSGEVVTVTLTRGKSISDVVCTWATPSDRLGSLTHAESTPLNQNAFLDTFTFTPDSAESYFIRCTGLAHPPGSTRPVSASSAPIPVEGLD
jgi:hypothetical protein